MYGQNAASAEAARPVPELSNQNERFAKALNHQNDLLDGIENGLHNILSRRGPEKQTIPAPKELNDFTASLSDKISSLENNNSRLERLKNHLSEII